MESLDIEIFYLSRFECDECSLNVVKLNDSRVDESSIFKLLLHFLTRVFIAMRGGKLHLHAQQETMASLSFGIIEEIFVHYDPPARFKGSESFIK